MYKSQAQPTDYEYYSERRHALEGIHRHDNQREHHNQRDCYRSEKVVHQRRLEITSVMRPDRNGVERVLRRCGNVEEQPIETEIMETCHAVIAESRVEQQHAQMRPAFRMRHGSDHIAADNNFEGKEGNGGCQCLGSDPSLRPPSPIPR